jgi:hypothetical protein
MNKASHKGHHLTNVVTTLTSFGEAKWKLEHLKYISKEFESLFK